MSENNNLDNKSFFDRNKSAKMMKELCDFIGLSLIIEIECESCKYKNKTKPDWVFRFGKDECESCGEELPLEKIYGGPTKDYINFILNEDEELESKKIERKLINYGKEIGNLDVLALMKPDIYIDPAIPDPIAEGLKKYIKEIEEREKQGKLKRKSVMDEKELGRLKENIEDLKEKEETDKNNENKGWGDL